MYSQKTSCPFDQNIQCFRQKGRRFFHNMQHAEKHAVCYAKLVLVTVCTTAAVFSLHLCRAGTVLSGYIAFLLCFCLDLVILLRRIAVAPCRTEHYPFRHESFYIFLTFIHNYLKYFISTFRAAAYFSSKSNIIPAASARPSSPL